MKLPEKELKSERTIGAGSAGPNSSFALQFFFGELHASAAIICLARLLARWPGRSGQPGAVLPRDRAW